MVNIEKDIPIPVSGKSRRRIIYPFGEMEIGDSFYWEGSKRRLIAAASIYGINKNRRYATRSEGIGMRCWRIE